MGYEQYEPISRRYRVPIVVAGFEPVDLLDGIRMAVEQLESGRAEVENQYSRAVRREGNLPARERIADVRGWPARLARHRRSPRGLRLREASKLPMRWRAFRWRLAM
jgi:hydrogenase expression/formation protein HypD